MCKLRYKFKSLVIKTQNFRKRGVWKEVILVMVLMSILLLLEALIIMILVAEKIITRRRVGLSTFQQLKKEKNLSKVLLLSGRKLNLKIYWYNSFFISFYHNVFFFCNYKSNTNRASGTLYNFKEKLSDLTSFLIYSLTLIRKCLKPPQDLKQINIVIVLYCLIISDPEVTTCWEWLI